MTTEVLAATVDRAVARVIQEGKRRCSGHVLVLDEYTIRRLLTEELQHEKQDVLRHTHCAAFHGITAL